MESRHCSEVPPQLFTVAPFKGMAEFFDSLACDLICLLDFHFVSSCFGESLLPSPHTEEARTRNRKKAERVARPGRNGQHA